MTRVFNDVVNDVGFEILWNFDISTLILAMLVKFWKLSLLHL